MNDRPKRSGPGSASPAGAAPLLRPKTSDAAICEIELTLFY